MNELNFIKEGIQKEEINRFITKEIGQSQISQCIIKKTPLYTHVLIYTQRPARIVGYKGTKLMHLKETISSKFKIKSLKMDVYSIDNPYLDASLMANFIARSLEQGKKHKRVVSFIIEKIMSSGAIGVEINVTGKISGSRSRGDKFYRGYLKKCGDPIYTCIDKKKVSAVLKQGCIGIKVTIMKIMPDVMQLESNINALEVRLKREFEKAEKDKAKQETEAKETTEDKTVAEEKPVEKEVKKEEIRKATETTEDKTVAEEKPVEKEKPAEEEKESKKPDAIKNEKPVEKEVKKEEIRKAEKIEKTAQIKE
ncbi:MAG: 30S ribosomal protein S3 [Candidatus Aenigmarchaeota archaeon]|nr:30S ribosomal protein S3 [Candidatus Aenigmarchaeota archaeon]